ncbi:MAG: helix-turn-helix domain-containing protein [Planctomycetia bacterium]|nr:helix-turn-helix domain-containing protein [Planctomycetia bacterium]
MPILSVPANSRQKFTPPQLADLWGISPDKIVAWIKSGELRAIDAATKRGVRPRFLIDVADVEAFERARSVTPPPPPRRKRSSKWY